MQLNFFKSSVLWKRQCREFAVVFLERDDVQIPGAAWLGSLSGSPDVHSVAGHSSAHSVSLIVFTHLNLSTSLKGDLLYNPILECEVHAPTCIFKLGTGCTSFPHQLLQQTSLILFSLYSIMTFLAVPLSRKYFIKALIFFVIFEMLIIYIMVVVWLGFQVNFRFACAAALYFFKFWLGLITFVEILTRYSSICSII